MFKLRVIKAISIVLVVTFSWQNVVGADPDFLAQRGTDTLAPELLMEKHGLEMQSLMFLADLAKRALSADLKQERLAEFIKASPALTSDIKERINFGMLWISDSKLHIGYHGLKGHCVLSFSKRTDQAFAGTYIAAGGMVISDIFIEIEQPPVGGVAPDDTSGRSPPEDISPDKGDVTHSSDGNIAIHEGEKKRFSWVPAFLRRFFIKWTVVGKLGVNDVIREFWKKGVPGKGCDLAEDMPTIIKTLFSMPGADKCGEDILLKDYKVYVYDVGRKDFADGVTTHFGIRTGNIHITKMEYDRLKALGMPYLAARIAHEVTEMEKWRKKADDLIYRDAISDLGDVPGHYDETWASGIRKWIRDNSNESGTGLAQDFDKEYHRKGLEQEISILAHMVMTSDRKTAGRQTQAEAVQKLVSRFRNGDLKELVSEPEAAVRPPAGIFSGIFEAMLAGLKQLNHARDREFFLNVVLARAVFDKIKYTDGEINEALAARPDISAKSNELFKRLNLLKKNINELAVIDSFTRAQIEEWLAEVQKLVGHYPPGMRNVLDPIFPEIRTLLSEKNRSEGWAVGYSRDPKDIVSAADQGAVKHDDTYYPDHDSGSSTGSSGAVRFGLGEMKSPKLANNILLQQDMVSQPMANSNDVINILYRYKNWTYRDLKGRSTAARNTDSSIGSPTKFEYITRFKEEAEFKRRIDSARRSARFLFMNPSVSAITGGSRNFRIFYGSSTGYFEVMDNKSIDYPHEINITMLVDGDCPLQIVDPELSEVKEIWGEFSDVNIRGVKITFVGTNVMKKAFEGDESIPVEERAKLQRLFINIYRESIQVAGSNIVEENSEFEFELARFERVYIREMVERLTQISIQKVDLEDLKKRIALAELTPQQIEAIEALRKEIAELDVFIVQCQRELVEIDRKKQDGKAKIDKKKQDGKAEIDKKKQALMAEQRRLKAIYDKLKQTTTRTGMFTVEELQAYEVERVQYDTDLNKWQEATSQIAAEGGRLDAQIAAEDGRLETQIAVEYGRLEEKIAKAGQERQKKATALAVLERKEREWRRQKEIYKFSEMNLERNYELMCKRIEDAQFGHPLAKGVVINNRYRILDELGAGGFGAVYRVEDLQMKQERAIKIMSPMMHASTSQREKGLLWFEREIKMLSELKEASAPVPAVEGRGSYAGMPYFIMTLAKGLTLGEIVKNLKNGTLRMSTREKVILMHGVMKAIARFHAAKAIHRDLKPDNIIVPVNPDGSVAIPSTGDGEQFLRSSSYDAFVRKIMIIDLGMAIPGEGGEISQTGNFGAVQERTDITGDIVVGTPHFMPPEQISPNDQNPIGSKSDIYAMGITLFRIFSHRFPIADDQKDWQTITLQHMSATPDWLCTMIDRENIHLQEERKKDRTVNIRRLEAIRKGLLDILIKEIPKDKPIVVTALNENGVKVLKWSVQALDEVELMKRLSHVTSLTDEEKDMVANIIIHKVPQVDGFIEAIVHRMFRMDQRERPTADQVVLEIEKYLTDKKDEMTYRPRGEVAKKDGLIVRMARWFSKHVALFAIVALLVTGVVASVFYYMYKTAVDQRQAALQESAAATNRMKDAETAVREAAAKMKALNEERDAIVKSLAQLKQETGSVAEQKATLFEQVEKLKKDAEKSAELEKAVAALEERIAALNKQEADLKERERKLKDDIARSEASLKSMREQLAKAQEEVAKFKKSLSGIFEEAKEKTRELDAEGALEIFKTRYPWWSITEADLGKTELGFNEILTILLDNGEFDKAMDLEARRKEWLNSVMAWRNTDMEKQLFLDEIIKRDISMVRLMTLKGDYEQAQKTAAALLESDIYKGVKKRAELAAGVYIEAILSQIATRDVTNETLQKIAGAEGLIKIIEQEDRRNLYYGRLYLAVNNHSKAMKSFEQYYAYWAKQVEEAGIDAGEKAKRQSNAAYGLFMQAMVDYAQASLSKTGGDAQGLAKNLDAGRALLARISKEYPQDMDLEISTWVLFIRGEMAALEGKGEDAKKHYEEAARLSLERKLHILHLLASSRLGLASGLKDNNGTWTTLLSGRVPLRYLTEVRKLLDEGTRKYIEAVMEAKRQVEAQKKLEEERLRQEELKRRVEEERKKAAEEAAALRKEALDGVNSVADAKLRLAEFDKQVQDLEKAIRDAADAAERTRFERQLGRARDKRDIVTEELKRLEEAERDKIEEDKDKNKAGQPGESGEKAPEGEDPAKKDKDEPKKDEPKKDEPKKDEPKKEGGEDAAMPPAGQGMLPAEGQSPIASDVPNAPDHRLLNAVINCAINEYLYSQRFVEGAAVMVLGTERCANFRDLYDRIRNKEEVERLFMVMCQRDVVPAGTASRLYQEGLGKLRNVTGHAGLASSKIFVVRGAAKREDLIKHEHREMVFHYKRAAHLAGYRSWKDVPESDRRRVIINLRSDKEYNVFAAEAHREANKAFPVSADNELIPDDGRTLEDAAEPALGYERPIAAGEELPSVMPIFTIAAIAGHVRKMAAAMRTEVPYPAGIPNVPADMSGKGVIIFADDVVDSSAVFDLDKMAALSGKEGTLLSKIVLFAENPLKAELVEKVIKENNPEADVVAISRDDLAAHYGQKIFETSRIEAVLRYSLNVKTGIFTRPDQILGVIRGPLGVSEDAETLRQELRRSSIQVPVVAFQDSLKGNLYSIMQAISKLVELRTSNRVSDGLLFILPPITRISETFQKEYERYVNMVRSLGSAA